MSKAPAGTSYDVVCPHCKKQFRGELMGDADDPLRGFKCPHCRLFVPLGRSGTNRP